MSKKIYLDFQATTPVDTKILEKMIPRDIGRGSISCRSIWFQEWVVIIIAEQMVMRYLR